MSRELGALLRFRVVLVFVTLLLAVVPAHNIRRRCHTPLRRRREYLCSFPFYAICGPQRVSRFWTQTFDKPYHPWHKPRSAIAIQFCYSVTINDEQRRSISWDKKEREGSCIFYHCHFGKLKWIHWGASYYQGGLLLMDCRAGAPSVIYKEHPRFVIVW